MSNINKNHQKRRDFKGEDLHFEDLAKDPFIQYETWFNQAIDQNIHEPFTACLASVDETGQPSNRMLYIRGIIDESFVFYTNYKSRKANDLTHNPKACLNVFWADMHRQIIIEGIVEKLPEHLSDDYFNSRPRSSQIGAWSSHQSKPLKSSDELQKRLDENTNLFQNKDIPRPDFWGGFVLKPTKFEFWQGKPSRLHDRFIYSKNQGEKWEIQRLNP